MGSVTDWDAKVVIGSKSKPGVAKSEKDINAARRSGAAIDSERKLGAGNKAGVDPDHQRIAALDRKDDPTPPATVSADVGKAMMKARQDLGLSQKDLAQKSNEVATLIQSYESGKAIPSPQVLSKLEKILKVKLRGKDIGAPLLSPAEKKAQAEAEKGNKKK